MTRPLHTAAARTAAVLLAAWLLAACTSSSAPRTQASRPHRPGSRTPVVSSPVRKASTPASTSPSDDQPRRHSRLAHRVCTLEVALGMYVDLHAAATALDKIGSYSYELMVLSAESTLQKAPPRRLHPKAYLRRLRGPAAAQCSIGSNPIDNLPNEVLTRGQLAKLRGLLPQQYASLFDKIDYFG